MPFRFSLSAILHLRKLHEDRERMRLLASQSRLQAAEIELKRIAQLRAQVHLASEHPGLRATGSELNFAYQCTLRLAEAEQLAQYRVRDARRDRDRQSEIYDHARQSSEIIESLREKELDDYKIDERRKEQQLLDEIHTITRSSGQGLPTHPADVAQLSPTDRR